MKNVLGFPVNMMLDINSLHNAVMNHIDLILFYKLQSIIQIFCKIVRNKYTTADYNSI